MTNSRENTYIDYYTEQKIITKEEVEQFKECINSELPSTFWICCPENQNSIYRSILLRKISQILRDVIEDNKEPIQRIEWATMRDAYQLNSSRHQIKKNQAFKDFKKFIFSQMEAGFIRRQEAVSMIPPLMMDIEPHHKVLDLCSAPGSKTAQILDLLAKGNDDIFNNGFVVANDSDLDRCCLMLHQLNSLSYPNLGVTCCDARYFPHLVDHSGNLVFFDRILADVPCSSDGTVRKSPDILKSWTTASGISLHGLQKNILTRAIQLLSVGGRLVYSTCSLNPIEDEAVVAAVLEKNTCVRLVPPNLDDSLIARAGLEDWKVVTKNGEAKNWEDLPPKLRRDEYRTLFPPPNAQELNLHYCRRVLPHSQNTGGFFYAVVEKVHECDSVPTGGDNHRVTAKRSKRIRGLNPFEEECSPVSDEVYSEIKSFYGLNSPRISGCKFRGKSERSVLIVNEPLCELLAANRNTLTVVGIGVKAFKKEGNNYRIMTSVVNTPFLGQKATNNVVCLTATDILQILETEALTLEEVDAELASRLCQETGGYCIIRCCGLTYPGVELDCLPSFVARVSTNSVKHMVDKTRRDGIRFIYQEFVAE